MCLDCVQGATMSVKAKLEEFQDKDWIPTTAKIIEWVDVSMPGVQQVEETAVFKNINAQTCCYGCHCRGDGEPAWAGIHYFIIQCQGDRGYR